MTLRDASLSDSYASDRCCFSSPDRSQNIQTWIYPAIYIYTYVIYIYIQKYIHIYILVNGEKMFYISYLLFFYADMNIFSFCTPLWFFLNNKKHLGFEPSQVLAVNPFMPTVPTFAQRRYCSQSTIVSEGLKGGTRGAPIMPRDVSFSDSKCWNGGHKWVK